MAAGKEDIAPELLKKVQEDYRKRCENDKELARIEALAESGKANGKDTDAYAVRAGELLAAALHDNVSGDVLPDGKMYFNIANRVLPPVLRDNYELVAGMSTRIQQVLNDNAGLHMKALRPDLNEDRVKGLVNLAASADQYEDKRKELEAHVVNFSQRISADGFHKNAEFQYTSGFTPKIRREAESGCCEWCQALEGTYDYADVRDTGNDVWRRHRDCKCIVEYDPGTGRRQNARTKTWSQADDHRKKIEDAERMMEEREREKEEKSIGLAASSKVDTWVDALPADARDKYEKIIKRGTEPLQHGFSCFGNSPTDRQLAYNASQIPAQKGYFDVAMHGTPTAVCFGTDSPNMGPRLLASIIKSNPSYNGENIRLFSCRTGETATLKDYEYCFAEELANNLGVRVEAPDDLLYISSNGSWYIGMQQSSDLTPYTPNQRGRYR